MGDMAKILYHGYYFSFTWGVDSAGKCAICDRVHLLKLMKACNRSLMLAFFRFHFQCIQHMFPIFGIEGGYCRRFVASRHFLCGQSPHQLIIMGSLGVDTALDTD